MSEYTIESGIEVPEPRGFKTAFYRIPFKLLLESKVGDSVWIKSGEYDCHQIASAIHSMAKRAGVQTACRNQSKDGKKGVRVWYLGKREENKQ